jgi:large subunit ribosomal protein L22
MSLISGRRLEESKTAFARSSAIKGSMQKVGLVCNMIQGMDVHSALLQLQFLNKRAANDVRQVLSAAIANAENNKMLNIDSLYVSDVLVGKSFNLKRFQARGRGRASRINKPYSQITIFVTERE